tara:strand:- start:3446 stop:4768 length:1323 start_codon:yes stop_codon:yes gene_type:complete
MKLSKEDLVEFVNKTRKTYLKETNPYEVVPGTGRKGVSGIVSPLQTMADEEDFVDGEDLPEIEFELPDDEDIDIRNIVDQPDQLDSDKYKLYSAGAGNPFMGTVQETTKLTDKYIKQLVKEYTKDYRRANVLTGDRHEDYQPDDRYIPGRQRLNKAGYSRDFFDAPTIVDDEYYEKTLADLPDNESEWTEDQRNLAAAYNQRRNIKHPLDPKYKFNWEWHKGSDYNNQRDMIEERNAWFYDDGPEGVGYWDAEHGFKPEDQYAFTSNKDRLISMDIKKDYMKGYNKYSDEKRIEASPLIPAEVDPRRKPGPYAPGQAPYIPGSDPEAPLQEHKIKLTDNYIKQLIKEAYVHLEEEEGFGLKQAQDAIRSDEDEDERAASKIRKGFNSAKANEQEVVSALKDMIALYKSLSWRKQRSGTRVYYKIMEVYKLLKKGSHGGVM